MIILLDIFIIFISAIFTLAGSINLGFSGIFCSIPFICILILFTFGIYKKTIWGKAIGMFLLFCLGLYWLRENSHSIYFPLNGETIYLESDVCTESTIGPILIDRNKQTDKNNCPEGRFFAKGTPFKILTTNINHSDFGERHVLVLHNLLSNRVIEHYSPPHSFADDYAEVNFQLSNGNRLFVSHVMNEDFRDLTIILYYWILFPAFFFWIFLIVLRFRKAPIGHFIKFD